MNTEPRYYDNSRISDFKTCKRMYFFRHVCHLTGARTNYATGFGSSWHSAMNRVWQAACSGEPYSTDELVDLSINTNFMDTWHEETGEEGSAIECSVNEGNWRTPMVAKEMLYHYITTRRDFMAEFELVAIERPFVVPIDPNDPNKLYCGIIDKTVRRKRNGKISYMEHKSTSEYAKIGGFKRTFLDKFSPDSQTDGYYYNGVVEYAKDFDSIYIDAALVHKNVHDKFKIIPIDRGVGTIEQWLWETHYYIDEIESNLTNLSNVDPSDTAMAAFPRNTGACMLYGACPYYDICQPNPKALMTLDPPGYTRKVWDPAEKAKLHTKDVKGGVLNG